MKPDPPVRKDGKCAVCPKPREPQRSEKYAKDAAYSDPFCSAPCCRKYHGTEISPHGAQHGQTPRSKHVPICGEHSGYKSGCRCPECMEWMRMDQRRRRDRIKREGGLRPGHKHSAASYRNGCRCDGCREAYRPWQKQMRARKQEAA